MTLKKISVLNYIRWIIGIGILFSLFAIYFKNLGILSSNIVNLILSPVLVGVGVLTFINHWQWYKYGYVPYLEGVGRLIYKRKEPKTFYFLIYGGFILSIIAVIVGLSFLF